MWLVNLFIFTIDGLKTFFITGFMFLLSFVLREVEGCLSEVVVCAYLLLNEQVGFWFLL